MIRPKGFVTRTMIGAIFFVLGSGLCVVVKEASWCRDLQHIGEILLAEKAS